MAKKNRRAIQNLGADKTGRSSGEGQYFKMSYRMAQSPAIRSLNGSALKVFIELRCRFNGSNNGKMTLSMDEASRLLHMSKSTVRDALDQLIDRGLVKRTKLGQWYGRLASEYAVTDRSIEGVPPTNDWNQWQPPKKQRKQRKKQKFGTDTEPSGSVTVRREYRRAELCSVRVPVSTIFTPVIGTDTERLYTISTGEALRDCPWEVNKNLMEHGKAIGR